MNRRNFIAICGGLAAGYSTTTLLNQMPETNISKTLPKVSHLQGSVTRVTVSASNYPVQISDRHPNETVLDNIALVPNKPETETIADIILDDFQRQTFISILARLRRLQRYVGYGNFNIISWDKSLKIARNHDAVGAFTRFELAFIEELFSINADTLGFYGDKVTPQLSATITTNKIVKIPASGHYLFKGDSMDVYHRIRRDIGESIVLTSGIRSVVKQIYLFLNKADKVDGNLSLASHSLAPPGHSYHAIGDFDVGKKGFGEKNFSAEFANTDEFKHLSDLGYLDIRYPQDNLYGVRYEPWHIKIV